MQIGFARSLFIALLATGLSAQQPQSQWQSISPGGETGCAFGNRFEFWVREGDPQRLLIYLQGGGACWSLESCDPKRSISFDGTIDSTDYRQRTSGVFDRSARENPFRGYTQVFVPYCTGDFHLGAREVRYSPTAPDSLPGITVRHLGSRNLEAVLVWLAHRKILPGMIVVSGGSAGAIASPVLAGKVAERIPTARIVQIGDGVAGIHNVRQAKALLAVWGADSVLRGLGVPVDSATDVFTAIYQTVGAAHPAIHFSQIATDSDAVVAGWLKRFGYDPAAIPANIRATYDELTSAGLCFNGYQVSGSDHTILWRPEFLQTRGEHGPLIEQLTREVLEKPCARKAAAGAGEAAFLFAYRPRPELADSFFAGYRRHLAWHSAHSDSLPWFGWNVVDGPGQGTFVDGTFGISFGAFDIRVEPGADGADMAANVLPFGEPIERQVYRLRPELGSARRLEQRRPGAMQKVVRLQLRPGELLSFEQALRSLSATSPADFAVYECLSGGPQPSFLVITQLNSWGDLALPSADPSSAILRQVKAIASAESAIWLYQSSLSYMPIR